MLNGSITTTATNQPVKQKCRAPSPPKHHNSQIIINKSNDKKQPAPLPPKIVNKFSNDSSFDQNSHHNLHDEEEDNSLNQLNDTTSHVSIVTIKDDKDVSIIKTSTSSTPKIKNENKTIFQVENEQQNISSFLSNSNRNQNHNKHSSDYSDYNHRQQIQSTSPPAPPLNISPLKQQQYLISTKQTVAISEQINEKELDRNRSRPSSYIEMKHQESLKELNNKNERSKQNKVDKLQQINDKLNETNSPKQRTHSTKCTKTDQASLDFMNRNVRREPSNAGSLSSVDSNQQSITRNNKIIEKGMAMVQLRKHKVGDKVSTQNNIG